mgnify:CR=1 FL=1
MIFVSGDDIGEVEEAIPFFSAMERTAAYKKNTDKEEKDGKGEGEG